MSKKHSKHPACLPESQERRYLECRSDNTKTGGYAVGMNDSTEKSSNVRITTGDRK